MKKNYKTFILLTTLYALLCLSLFILQAQENNTLSPPQAEKIPKELTIHNHTRIDKYYWLKERDNPKILEYLNAENEYTKYAMKSTEMLQKQLYQEMVNRIQQEDMSAPYKKNHYYYYKKFEKEKEYPIYCRRKNSMKSKEEIILDVNKMANGHNYYHVTGIFISKNNKLAAFGADDTGRRKYTIYIKDIKSDSLLNDKLINTTGYIAWANDNKTIFYVSKDEITLRPYKVYRHIIGTDQSTDKLAYYEIDETYDLSVSKSKSDKYIFIASESTLTTEYRFLNADKPNDEFIVFYPREKNLEYYIDHLDEYFYIRTNLNAKNFRLMKTKTNTTHKENWTEVSPHNPKALLEDFTLFNQYIILNEMKEGLTQFKVIEINTNKSYYLDFNEETYTADFAENFEIKSDNFRYYYNSLTTPTSVYSYNIKTQKRKLIKRDNILGGFQSENYASERHMVPARDGTLVPLSLVYRKGIKKHGSNPLLLYGYGSYGFSYPPSFRPERISLLDRGFIFAIAHIRGGSEMGHQWYENGKLLNKKNTFYDFIDCAEYLINKKYTSADKLFAMGGSAGGLLIGAVINIRPDLFKGAIAEVPFVDVITTMLDETIPLTTSEYDEWGNPNDKEYYDYMLSYSPYDNVEAKNYPNLLVTTALHDSQVQYWEPAKWVAKLRELKTDNNKLLLYTNMEAGHSGKPGRFQKYEEITMEYAFILSLLI